MKSFRSTLFAAFAVLLLAAVAYAQSAVTASDVQKSEVQKILRGAQVACRFVGGPDYRESAHARDE